ncbi:MAG: surface-adhesin E family protein [Sulfuricellaceae bacterium]
MKKFAPVLLMALLPLSVLAQTDDADWKQQPSSQEKYKLYLNAKTYQREGDVVNVTMRYVFAEPQVFPFLNIKYNRMERSFAFQCKEHKSVALDNNYYMGDKKVHSINPVGGNPFQSKEQALIPQKVAPSTHEDEALTQSCSYMVDKK